MEYQLQENIAIISFDDGSVNAVDFEFAQQIGEFLHQADQEADAVVLNGNAKAFSAGYNTKVLATSSNDRSGLVFHGFEMLNNLFKFSKPTVAACRGHAIGLGAFMLLCADTRIGAKSDYKVSLPETALGMPFTDFLMAILMHRVNPNDHMARIVQSIPCSPEQAVSAGFLDLLVDDTAVLETAIGAAKQLTELPTAQYAFNKQHLRAKTAEQLAQFLHDFETSAI